MKIAMWSGPRNLSTAMMYSFAARGDCSVIDEPFYAAYLAATGLDHPMRDEILKSQETDPNKIISACLADHRQTHSYQKHMCHHMLPGISRDWMSDFVNVFLIRHPARVVASYGAKREAPTLEDIGFRQQAELYDHAVALGQTPVVIDSADIRDDPAFMLHALCDAIGLDWTENMLHWLAGGHPDDGVWAAHWYGAVHQSTGFGGPEGPLPELAASADIAAQATPFYERLARHKITS